jgi:hypothetical protein
LLKYFLLKGIQLLFELALLFEFLPINFIEFVLPLRNLLFFKNEGVFIISFGGLQFQLFLLLIEVGVLLIGFLLLIGEREYLGISILGILFLKLDGPGLSSIEGDLLKVLLLLVVLLKILLFFHTLYPLKSLVI